MSSRRSEVIESRLVPPEKNSIVFRHATAAPEDPWLRRFDVPRFSFGKRSTTSYGVLVPGRPSKNHEGHAWALAVRRSDQDDQGRGG